MWARGYQRLPTPALIGVRPPRCFFLSAIAVRRAGTRQLDRLGAGTRRRLCRRGTALPRRRTQPGTPFRIPLPDPVVQTVLDHSPNRGSIGYEPVVGDRTGEPPRRCGEGPPLGRAGRTHRYLRCALRPKPVGRRFRGPLFGKQPRPFAGRNSSAGGSGRILAGARRENETRRPLQSRRTDVVRGARLGGQPPRLPRPHDDGRRWAGFRPRGAAHGKLLSAARRGRPRSCVGMERWLH